MCAGLDSGRTFNGLTLTSCCAVEIPASGSFGVGSKRERCWPFMSGDFQALNGAVIILCLRINGIARNAIAPTIPIRATIHKEGTTPTADIEADMERGAIADVNCFAEVHQPRRLP
jgi:hypothetical protein